MLGCKMMVLKQSPWERKSALSMILMLPPWASEEKQ